MNNIKEATTNKEREENHERYARSKREKPINIFIIHTLYIFSKGFDELLIARVACRVARGA
jgi:hypothetical protein